MTKGLSNVMGTSHSTVFSGTGDLMDLVCHVILQEQVIKGSCDFIGGSLFGCP